MRGEPSAEFILDAEIERNLHRRRRNARLDSKEEVTSDHLDSVKETMAVTRENESSSHVTLNEVVRGRQPTHCYFKL